MSEGPPTARVETIRGVGATALKSPYWLVTLACLVLAAGLFYWAGLADGVPIVIRFQQGHGLKPGDRLRHRGIDVGEVTAVRLNDGFDGVHVDVVLQSSAAALARQGSLFWIERPQLGLARLRGLDTVVGAKYLGVVPGPADAPAQFEFQGEEHPISVQGSQVREITVRFKEGYGLVVGDALRHRGIRVGEVAAVNLSPDLDRVEVHLRLQGFASRLARAGSRFWVVRPQVSLSGVQGLDTVVGGRYISVLPGPPEAANLSLFDGLEAPPTTVTNGLEIILESPHRFGVEAGAPVNYRGMQVGSVASVRLATDSTQVETRVLIDPDYRALVCEGTRFWSTSGIDINVGLTGFELNADTLRTIAAGGIAFATPPAPGNQVSTGHRFPLDRKGEQAWLAWAPRLATGPNRLSDGSELPEPQPLVLRWQVKQLTWRRYRQRAGLVLPLDDGRWLGPADLLQPPEDAIEGSVRLEFAGQEHEFDAERLQVVDQLAAYQAGSPGDAKYAWSTQSLRTPAAPEDCVIVPGGADRPIPLAADRLTVGGGAAWVVDTSFTTAPEWHGASVIAASDGSLVAILDVDTNSGNVVAQFVQDGLRAE